MSKSLVKYHAEAWDILQHLFKEKRINDRTIHFAAAFSENLDLECLKKSVDLSADVFPMIQCGFPEHGGRPYWEDKGYTSDDMVEFLETKDVDAAVWKTLQKEANETNGPQVKITIIRDGKTDTLCIAIDRIKIFTGSNDMTKPDAAKFDFEGDLNRPFIEMKTVPREKVGLLKDYAKLHGATVNDVLLTAYIRTLYRHFGRVVSVPCAVDLRKYLPNRKAGSICNLVTNLKCDIGDGIGASFDCTLEKVKEKMAQQKANIISLKSILLMEAVFRIIPYSVMGKAVDPFFSNPLIAFTNLGILDKGKLAFGKTKMTGAFMTSSIKYVPYFQIAVSTFDDVMALSANLYGTQADRNKISSFLTAVISELCGAV